MKRSMICVIIHNCVCLIILGIYPKYTEAQLSQANLLISGLTTACGGCSTQGQSIIQTHDSGFAISGDENGYGSGKPVYIVKLDKRGDLKWTRTVGGTNGENSF